MKFTFLGTGTSQGVPLIGCKCSVCTSSDPRDNRLRTSLMVETEFSRSVIDTGPDFRQQMLKEKVTTLNSVVFTHEHKDHISGLDDVRAFNYLQKKAMAVYATERVQQALKREFFYIFSGDDYPGIPKIDLHTITDQAFQINDIPFQPLPVLHMNLPVMGFRIGGFSYITDANQIPEATMKLIEGSDILVLNALRKEKHISHFSLDEAVKIIEKVKAKKAYLTHISHQLGLHKDVENQLPNHIRLAYDGLQIEL